jgi:hypothetical protein
MDKRLDEIAQIKQRIDEIYEELKLAANKKHKQKKKKDDNNN